MSGEIGIIYPPPELRNIVDKTAGFVARNGPEFEARIQQNEQNNPKFNFLRQGDPYNAYYRHKIKDFLEAKEKGLTISAPASSAPGSTTTISSGQNNKTAKQLEALAEPLLIVKDPPPDFEFSAEPPTLSALDLEVVKMTAQFVAANGPSFLTNLMNREQRNYQFDFLRPAHGLFGYFKQLVGQYSMIITPPKGVSDELRKEIEKEKAILDKVRYRMEWTKIKDAERRREEEEAERERVQYAQIDWHDFVVVETVDYQPHETGMFPPPTTPEQVGSRILLQQRIEEAGGQDADVEMDVESDEEKDGGEAQLEAEKAAKKAMPPPPLPPSLDNVLIKKDYNPKAAKPAATAASAKSDAWVVSPITGEKIPAEKLQEHMRYGLLDPRWVEERDRSIQEKMAQEEVFAPGTAIESSLKQLAERRTDIFGSGAEETAIGKKIGEEDKRKPEKPTWDGHIASAESVVRAARSSISIQEQIQQIHKLKGLTADEEKDRIGPAVIPSNQPHHQQSQQQQQQQRSMPQLPSVSIVTSSMNQPRPPLVVPPSAQASYMIPAQQVPLAMGVGMGVYGMVPPGLAIPAMPGFGLPMQPEMQPAAAAPALAEQGSGEPPAKMQKTEDKLIPEAEFLAANESPVTFRVSVPQATDKPEWNLNGQSLSFTMPLTDSIAAVKNKIHESLGMPPGKQKLQLEGIFVKDSNSLAFYNLTPGAVIQLQLKERGGRKK